MNNRWLSFILTLVLIIPVACSSTEDTPDNTVDDVPLTIDNVTYQDLPVSLCGMSPYELLDPATVGKVVSHEATPVVDMPGATIQSLLSAGGLELSTTHDAKVYRYRYTTQDRGEEIEATAMIGFPVGENVGTEPLAFVSFAHVTAGFSDICAAGRNFIYQMVVAGMASKGYIVIASDYIGMTSHGDPSTTPHAYQQGEPAAIGAWDALKAGEELIKTLAPELTTTRQTILAGASQGSSSVFFQERFGPYYAPQFEVAGVVGLVPILDLLKSSNLAVDTYQGNSFYNAVMHVSGNQWYGFDSPLSSLLSNIEPYFLADNAHELFYNPEECAYDSELQESLDSIEKIYNPDHVTTIQTSGTESIEHWNCMTRENSIIYSSVPKLRDTPTLLYYAENDPMIPPETYQDSFVSFCETNRLVEYNICAGALHSEGVRWSMSEALEWVEQALAGELSGPTCELKPAHCCAGSPSDICE